MKADADIVKKIIKRYGEVINLKTSPSTIIDIIRIFGSSPDGGLPPGGTPPSPPGPTSLQGHVSNDEIMKGILKVSRDIGKIKRKLNVR